MATLEDRQKAGDAARLRWRVRWRDPAGDARSRSFARKDDALRFLHDIERRLDAGQYLDPARGRATLASVAAGWWAHHEPHLKPSTAVRYRGILEGRLRADLGSVPVVAVDYATVAAWQGALIASGQSGSSVRAHMQVLSQVLDHAVRDRRIPQNPARLVRRPRNAPARRHRYLTAEQLDRLATACGEFRPLVLTLGYCGLRWGEAVALRPEDIDARRGRLHIDRAATRATGEVTYHAPKTHRRREVPVPDFVLEELAGLEPVGGLVFTTGRGAPMSANFGRRVFPRALEEAGLPAMRVHELRHTAASLAVASGADVLVVARMLGHADPAMTLRVYADLFDSALDDLRERLDRVARKAAAPGEVVALETYRRA